MCGAGPTVMCRDNCVVAGDNCDAQTTAVPGQLCCCRDSVGGRQQGCTCVGAQGMAVWWLQGLHSSEAGAAGAGLRCCCQMQRPAAGDAVRPGNPVCCYLAVPSSCCTSLDAKGGPLAGLPDAGNDLRVAHTGTRRRACLDCCIHASLSLPQVSTPDSGDSNERTACCGACW